MGLFSAAKIAALAISIIGSTSVGGMGLSYTLKNRNLSHYREKRKLEKEKRRQLEEEAKKRINLSRQEVQHKTMMKELGFKAEAIFKGMSENSYFCWEWTRSIYEQYKSLDSDNCQKKVKKRWGEDVSKYPEKWFRSDPESAIRFFSEYLFLTGDKHHLLKSDSEKKWTTKEWECSHKKDGEYVGVIVASCYKEKSIH
ncbi:hypothetical protein [Mycoplasma suis]|uniref:Uncharacterized protein n=1 Tax=Mycoplasma suis (strain Illinois) TaxID=768700 RepID=F0QQD1_MYCSL|nr:hypothetical protein [Mycoplasma suis]ADX97701.1 hypothetical protein MSU_0157 [Mycoplasma suis str. Illinois]